MNRSLKIQSIGLFLIVVLCVGMSSSAAAFWKRNEDVVQNAAHTLEAEEFLIGVFMPLQYGIFDELTLSVHPVLELLLTPNVTLRYKVLEDPVTVSLTAGYVQTFIRERDEGGFPGTVEAGALVSISLNDHMVLTPYAGYLMDFATLDRVKQVQEVRTTTGQPVIDFATSETMKTLDFLVIRHGLSFGLGFNWIIDSENLLIGQLRAVIALDGQVHELPQFSLLWAHAWKKTRLGIGVAAGQFPVRTGDAVTFELPVYPILDLWVRI